MAGGYIPSQGGVYIPSQGGVLGRGALSRLEAGGTRIPSLVMDRPVLHTFVDALRTHERFQGFAQALPTRARVSEPILPLILAALHEELERPLVCLLPDDADARDAAEAAGWFLGTQGVALFPSRGVSWGSGLEPPPHLVGERARALDVLVGEGSSARPRKRSPRGCRPQVSAPRRSAFEPATSRASRSWPSGSRSPATSASSASRSAASSQSAAA